jgi:hypothetical protein
MMEELAVRAELARIIPSTDWGVAVYAVCVVTGGGGADCHRVSRRAQVCSCTKSPVVKFEVLLHGNCQSHFDDDKYVIVCYCMASCKMSME